MLFNFKVKDSLFPQEFSGEIESESYEKAEQEIKEEYAYELDTTEEEIEIIELREVE